MKFGIIREGKTPPDRRVVFSPVELLEFKEKYPQASFAVQPSEIRVFKDEDYEKLGFSLQQDLSDCQVLFGVKEVPIEQLISDKTYFFFSHTIKKQSYNQKLLRTCLDRNITLIDHETIVDTHGHRLIGFGRYAGIVGCYNTFRAFGIKYELYSLPKAETLHTQEDLIKRLRRLILPPIKIVLTGKGKVGFGAKEMLVGMKMKEVTVEQFLKETFDEPVFVQIDVEDYYKRKDHTPGSKEDFKKNAHEYESDFEKFSQVADIFVAGHFYAEGSPHILTKEMLNAAKNQIKVVGDISCDIDGPIECTIRSSTIEDPFYGYYPRENKEVHYDHPAAIVVMAVDNLPCELPKDASEGFGEMFLKEVVPAFFNEDQDKVLERATICKNGKLTERFAYLADYAEGKH